MEYDVDFLQQVNDNVDLVKYVGQQIDLKQKGKDYFGRCPLHVDKTPSFSINSDDNYFYCFSCGKSGGIIQYLRYYEGMDFDSAVKKRTSYRIWIYLQCAIPLRLNFLRVLENHI